MTNKDTSPRTAEEQAQLDELRRIKAAAEQQEQARLAQEAEQNAMKAKAVGRVLGRRLAGIFGKR